MKFIVASYGKKHVGMLLAHLHSIVRSHPRAGAAVYWQDIPDRLIEALRATFSDFDFRQTDFDFSSDYHLRISSKVRSWCRAAEEHSTEARLCFADVDTLVLRDIGSFFHADDAEIIFTAKPERTALNTGVLLASGGAASPAFFRVWRDRTLEIIRTPERFRQANDYSLGYGAADQMALWELLRYDRKGTRFEIGAEDQTVRLRAEPCALLNETNSVPITADKYILHYKGGWQPILLEGRPFTKNRPRTESWAMFAFYHETFREALQCLNAATGGGFTAENLGVVVPSYFDEKTSGFDPSRYAIWSAREAGKAALRRMRSIANRLKGGLPSHS